MGAKDSKPSFITYEDAVKRVSDSELRRIREAFKRCAGATGTSLSLEAFVHEVLCDGVPYEVAEWLYQACGGTKRGIAFRELLCGIVVLTKGNLEEKIKFLWTLYVNNQSDNGTYIYKRDFARSLHLENTSLPVSGAPRTAEILLGLFGPGEKVTFEQFRSWLLIHKDATVLSQWLLSGGGHVAQDLETPTFYQSLAGVTHLEERDIIELEKCFWSLRNSAPTGQLDAESLSPLLSPPLPRAAVAGAILAFDENRDGHVDFKELCCGLSAACRGPRTERLKFCFKIFDMDRDGVLNKKELIDMVGILCTVANEALKQQGSRASTPDAGDAEPQDKGFDPEVVLLNLKGKLVPVPKKPMFQLGPSGEEEMLSVKETQAPESEREGLISNEVALTQEDFLIWSVESADALVTPFLELLFEVCHVVLGLRPQCRHQERDIVLGWLRRSVARGYSVGQFWYLVGAEWWGAWLQYTGGADACCRAAPRHVDEAIVCDESFTSNSTESMGSLLWRAETGSLGSASSSGVSSACAPRPPPHPGPLDNKRLRAPNTLKVPTLTGEGGHLRRDVTLAQHRDFELVPDALWRALALWYGGPDPLPRQVIRPPNSDVELELYPLQLKILRHVPNTQRSVSAHSAGAYGAGAAGVYSSVPAPPERQLAYTAAFSRLATVKQVSEFLCGALGLAREDVRLWALGSNNVLLDDERPTLHELRLDARRLLLERRNPDLTWPEEITALSGSRATERRETLIAPNMPGATGLHNLGNTCFMNAALQSVWNTGPLTQYFNAGMHLYELNTTNPLGTKGALALRFGELCKEVWSCSARSVAPLRVRWCVSRWARALGGGGQHDAQELLAWLLDALHEDLNRAAPAPHPAPRDSDQRPDQVVAAEAWEAYSARNNSILTDLFCGQLKSRVRCAACRRDSVRFDTFNMLSLPLPMESYLRTEVRVILLDGSVPVKYGVRVNSEGTYLELKQKLSALCGLPVDKLLLAELAGACLGRLPEDAARVCAASAADLYAYQLPDTHVHDDHNHAHIDHAHRAHRAGDDGWRGADADGGAGAAEVSVARGASSSLCMPALFCFKRSRSEILMSQSPPAFYAGRDAPEASAPDAPGDLRTRTLPKELRRDQDNAPHGSPTLSVRSLNLKPASPRLAKARFGSSPSNMCAMEDARDGGSHVQIGRIQYLVAVHRKQCRMDAYFLSSQRCKPALFGVPLLVALRPGMSGRDLYAAVWTQVARLLSARPPTHEQTNHATDCDDSLGYEFPFTLRLVGAGGAWCGACAWPQLCRGCALPTDHRPLLYCCRECPSSDVAGAGGEGAATEAPVDPGAPGSPRSPAAAVKLQRQHSARRRDTDELSSSTEQGVIRRLEVGGARRGLLLAIDWDPTALHLRYQTTREKAWVAHASVGECGAAAAAVDLASCLRAFTSDEALEQRYHCAACRALQPAAKKLQLWRAPPVLIIHLKRFQYVNNKWIKSHKVVNFPFENFDPTEFLAAVPQETVLRYRELSARRRESLFNADHAISESESDDDEREDERDDEPKQKPKAAPAGPRRESLGARRQRLESASLAATPVSDDNLVDYHQHRLAPHGDPFRLEYNLYAVVSHSGQLHGGHYVSYARNPSGAWLCYNDSMCREVNPRQAIDPAAAYLLFYERKDLKYSAYLPSVSGAAPAPPRHLAEPDDADLPRNCSIA